MKKFTKLIFSCAAVAALTAALGTAALAEQVDIVADGDSGITGKYDTTTGVLTIDHPESLQAANAQITIVVLNKNSENVVEDDIEYINQVKNDTAGLAELAGAKLGVVVPESGTETYYVRVGGDNGTIKKGKITLGEEEKEGTPFVYGNVNMDAENVINGADATLIVRHQVGVGTPLTGAALEAAKVNDSGDEINGADATCVVRKQLGMNGGTGRAGQSGTYYEN